MIRFSANLGFLWQQIELCDAIRAAAAAGFQAVEFHWPYEVDAALVAATLKETKLPLLGLNTRLGDKEAGEFGLSAVPGRQEQAIGYIDEAVSYAVETNCRNIHVMAGKSDASARAEQIYRENLHYACQEASVHGINILIEPINQRDVPGYHLSTIEAAIQTIEAVASPNLKLMFDCYHTQIMQGDICQRLEKYLDFIGHVQIAAVPDRAEPDHGELNYPEILSFLDHTGYNGYVGAEYRPRTTTEQGLSWMSAYQQ